jgi:hypothetical protein
MHHQPQTPIKKHLIFLFCTIAYGSESPPRGGFRQLPDRRGWFFIPSTTILRTFHRHPHSYRGFVPSWYKEKINQLSLPSSSLKAAPMAVHDHHSTQRHPQVPWAWIFLTVKVIP